MVDALALGHPAAYGSSSPAMFGSGFGIAAGLTQGGILVQVQQMRCGHIAEGLREAPRRLESARRPVC
jgi:hypothetical protein